MLKALRVLQGGLNRGCAVQHGLKEKPPPPPRVVLPNVKIPNVGGQLSTCEADDQFCHWHYAAPVPPRARPIWMDGM